MRDFLAAIDVRNGFKVAVPSFSINRFPTPSYKSHEHVQHQLDNRSRANLALRSLDRGLGCRELYRGIEEWGRNGNYYTTGVVSHALPLYCTKVPSAGFGLV